MYELDADNCEEVEEELEVTVEFDSSELEKLLELESSVPSVSATGVVCVKGLTGC